MSFRLDFCHPTVPTAVSLLQRALRTCAAVAPLPLCACDAGSLPGERIESAGHGPGREILDEKRGRWHAVTSKSASKSAPKSAAPSS